MSDRDALIRIGLVLTDDGRMLAPGAQVEIIPIGEFFESDQTH
jgi:hypothetical protein